MKSAKSREEEFKDPEKPRDPFAADFFGDSAGALSAEQITFKTVPVAQLPDGISRAWADSLPTASVLKKDKRPSLPEYPSWLEEAVTETLIPAITSFDLSDPVNGHFEVYSYDEIDSKLGARDELGLRDVAVTIEVKGFRGVIILSAEFASEIIDRVLDTPTKRIERSDHLSEIEIAICEFVIASALSELNDSSDSGIRLILGNISNGSELNLDIDPHSAEIVGDVVIGESSGMVSIVMPFGMLKILNDRFGTESGKSEQNNPVEKFGKRLDSTNLSLLVGKTSLAAVEIPFLEKGDVILVSDPVREWWSGHFDGIKMECLVGNSGNTYLSGQFVESTGFEIESAVNAPARASIQRINKSELDIGAKIVSEEINYDTAGDQRTKGKTEAGSEKRSDSNVGLVTLENVVVDLRVQIAGKKISLDEIGRFRAGQIIDLGCRPDDPVELFAENNDRPIAAGELVKIEDRLGVRILKLFV